MRRQPQPAIDGYLAVQSVFVGLLIAVASRDTFVAGLTMPTTILWWSAALLATVSCVARLVRLVRRQERDER